jgi:hypothetical protein
MEMWPRGLRQQVANLSYRVTGTVSSNLTVSAKLGPFSIMVIQWICNPLMAVRFCQGAPKD